MKLWNVGMKRFLPCSGSALPPRPAAAQQPRPAEHRLSRDQGRADHHPPAAGPRAEACRPDQGADEAGLLRRHRLPPRHRGLHGPDRRPDRHRHRRLGAAEHPGRVHARSPSSAARSAWPARIARTRRTRSSSSASRAAARSPASTRCSARSSSGMDVVDKIKKGSTGRERPGLGPGQDRQDAGRGRRTLAARAMRLIGPILPGPSS